MPYSISLKSTPTSSELGEFTANNYSVANTKFFLNKTSFFGFENFDYATAITVDEQTVQIANKISYANILVNGQSVQIDNYINKASLTALRNFYNTQSGQITTITPETYFKKINTKEDLFSVIHYLNCLKDSTFGSQIMKPFTTTSNKFYDIYNDSENNERFCTNINKLATGGSYQANVLPHIFKISSLEATKPSVFMIFRNFRVPMKVVKISEENVEITDLDSNGETITITKTKCSYIVICPEYILKKYEIFKGAFRKLEFVNCSSIDVRNFVPFENSVSCENIATLSSNRNFEN